MTELICPNCGASVAEVVKQYHSELSKGAVDARNTKLTPTRRSEIASIAGQARWDKNITKVVPIVEPIEQPITPTLYQCKSCDFNNDSKVITDYHELSHRD